MCYTYINVCFVISQIQVIDIKSHKLNEPCCLVVLGLFLTTQETLVNVGTTLKSCLFPIHRPGKSHPHVETFYHLKLTTLNCSLKRKGLKKDLHQNFQFCKSYDKKTTLLLYVHFSVHENVFSNI